MPGEILMQIIGEGVQPGDQQRVNVHPIDKQAQALELMARWESVYGQNFVDQDDDVGSLHMGDLIKEKRGLSRYNHDPVLILWRWLDPDSRQDDVFVDRFMDDNTCYSKAEPYDCVTGYLSDDGRVVVFAPHSSALLRPYEPTQD